jgi:hypothetical protein
LESDGLISNDETQFGKRAVTITIYKDRIDFPGNISESHTRNIT